MDIPQKIIILVLSLSTITIISLIFNYMPIVVVSLIGMLFIVPLIYFLEN